MSRRAAIYARISDDREGAGLGVERQERDCRGLAERLGWQVIEVYTDNDLSAFDRRKQRPSYKRMLEALREGHVTAVLTWHNDRLHRSVRELEDFIDLVEESKAAVQTVMAGTYDLTTATGRLQARMVGAFAQYESEHKRDRQLRKALELAEAGKVGNGGHRPFGFEADRMTVREEEASVLRELYAQVLAGRSLRSLRRHLSETGIRTTTGNVWSLQGLRYNLLSGRNAGLREHRGVVVGKAVWPPIVDRATWDQVGAVLRDSARYTGDHDGARRYVLTGFLRCGLCGKKLRPNRKASLQRFACRRDADGCGSILIRYTPAEEHVVDLILDRLEAEAHLTVDVPTDPTAELLAKIEAEEARLRRLVAAYAEDAQGDPLELRLAAAGHRAKIDQYRRDLASTVKHQPLGDPLAVRSAWLAGAYDLEQKRSVLNLLVERIDVGPAVRGRNYFDPDRLALTWR